MVGKAINSSNISAREDSGKPLCGPPHWADNRTEGQRGIYQKIHSFSAKLTCFLSLDVIKKSTFLIENRTLKLLFARDSLRQWRYSSAGWGRGNPGVGLLIDEWTMVSKLSINSLQRTYKSRAFLLHDWISKEVLQFSFLLESAVTL